MFPVSSWRLQRIKRIQHGLDHNWKIANGRNHSGGVGWTSPRRTTFWYLHVIAATESESASNGDISPRWKTIWRCENICLASAVSILLDSYARDACSI
ncbi:hypothetical protein AVEN_45265-1 [Araneus ventricosus]|uniref:Uncharacterized protein n=1 Tax=Araneus ventricosus TaxID=182803 RepID=A0A4Y2GLS2_ARAVE|nr:hypothetical protein AVEN_57667-1 [Araneus ventricosus]GBM54523.1 hypothetical protein AVEN_103520-1 [Araneus ventricosus]GBM54545.1 hypothetical protein AVEN_258996-1 [Araneus ventricosus]GBM54568.1 hypothetical protein AVEN_45265-1 [Araneus ventricosus]